MNFLNDTENNQNAKNHNKTKFCVRVLQLLNETLVDHSKIKDIGLAWCQDGVHFICNSQILGNYINLKANSINTNFRAHSFQIENISIIEIQKLFGSLPDIKNWKMRRNVSFDFTSDSFEFEVLKIPCLEKNKRNLEINSTDSNSVLPPITFDLLRNNQYYLHQVEMLMKKVDFMPNWKNKFLRSVSKDWLSMCQMCNGNQIMFCESINATELIKIIIDTAEPKIDHDIDIIEDSLNHLFRSTNSNSQSLSDLYFIDFIKLCLRFGTLKQIANTILEFSSQITQSFASWFVPSTDFNYATEIMARNDLQWCIKTSKTYPNVFTILINYDANKIQSSHIYFNPMPLKLEQRYFIKDDDATSIISRPTLRSFIEDVLKLAIPQDKISFTERKSIVHVPISTIAKRNNENAEKSQNEIVSFGDKLLGIEFPESFDQSSDFLSGTVSPEMTLNFSSSQPNQQFFSW